MKPEVVKRLQNEGIMHLRFCVELYNMQCDNGRYFVHEHPYSASSWGDREMLRLIYRDGVVFGKGHMCRQNMALCDARGPGLALKATGWLTNTSFILKELAILCNSREILIGMSASSTASPRTRPYILGHCASQYVEGFANR